MTTLVGLLTAAVTAIVLAALGHILLAGIAAARSVFQIRPYQIR